MPVNLHRHSDQFATAAQLAPFDLPELAAMGFRSVINNRPDGEGGPEQPSSSVMASAARASGLEYAHLPVVSGQYTAQDVQTMADLLAGLPGPVLAFCRSGARSTQLAQLALQLTPRPMSPGA